MKWQGHADLQGCDSPLVHQTSATPATPLRTSDKVSALRKCTSALPNDTGKIDIVASRGYNQNL
jgi:hypothetical protein